MIIIDCPYCNRKIALGFDEISNLVSRNKTDSKCHYCKNIFEIYNGKEKIESRIKENDKNV